MKAKFTTIDIKAVLPEIAAQFSGLRVANVYDVDTKTYLIKFNHPDAKKVLLFESGIRIHITEYDWPKGTFPSGFAMKLRKHLKGRRLESIVQLGNDRIVKIQFGSGEAAYNIILELYDRGNVILTDCELDILNVLRPRSDTDKDVKFMVREKYPIDLVQKAAPPPELQRLHEIMLQAKPKDNLRKILVPQFLYGPSVLEHSLQSVGFPPSASVGSGFDITTDLPRLHEALLLADRMATQCGTMGDLQRGFIVQKVETKTIASTKKGTTMETKDELCVNDEFHPFLFKQHESKRIKEFESFNKAVDEFFSQIEAQKIEMKTLHAEKQAEKKLEFVRQDLEKRVGELQQEQELDKRKAYLIELNLNLVDRALTVIRSALANQMDWAEIEDVMKEAQSQGDPIAKSIKALKLDKNHITLRLADEYDPDSAPLVIEVDLSLSAYANARKYYDQKRQAVVKEEKTLASTGKALESAERKAMQTLKEMRVTASIIKTRKTAWYEKFNWFITSENYLVIAGRDGQQNEIIVRRYFRQGDLYVHADIHGASSVVIKNHEPEKPIPPKSLNEAGTMAICHSSGWDSKIVTSAWWVSRDQVSKTAPSGEYLTTGSFMVRGKKNYLPPTYMVYGFGILFKLADEESIARHRNDRKVRVVDEDEQSVTSSVDNREIENKPESEDDEELQVSSESDNDDSDNRDSRSSQVTSGDLPLVSESDIAADKTQSSSEQVEAVSNEPPTLKHSTKDSDEGNGERPVSATEIDSDHSQAPAENGREVQEELEEITNEEFEFPDTEIQIQHVAGEVRYEVQKSVNETEDVDGVDDVASQSGSGVESARPAVSRKQRRDARKAKKTGLSLEEVQRRSAEAKSQLQSEPGCRDDDQLSQASKQSQAVPLTKKQKNKQKKIAAKYQDQDEEEREIRAALLREPQKDTKKRQKQRAQQKAAEERRIRLLEQEQRREASKQAAVERRAAAARDEVVEDEEIDEVEDSGVNHSQEQEGLISLTGCPHAKDQLLFAVPFCAPYSVLINFKYKVKLVPGSTKRGKAAKAAVSAFLAKKQIPQREKDLIRSLKDEEMSRNIPGKVKISTSQVKSNSKR